VEHLFAQDFVLYYPPAIYATLQKDIGVDILIVKASPMITNQPCLFVC